MIIIILTLLLCFALVHPLFSLSTVNLNRSGCCSESSWDLPTHTQAHTQTLTSLAQSWYSTLPADYDGLELISPTRYGHTHPQIKKHTNKHTHSTFMCMCVWVCVCTVYAPRRSVKLLILSIPLVSYEKILQGCVCVCVRACVRVCVCVMCVCVCACTCVKAGIQNGID